MLKPITTYRSQYSTHVHSRNKVSVVMCKAIPGKRQPEKVEKNVGLGVASVKIIFIEL